MRDKRFWFGTGVSGIWILCIISFVLVRKHDAISLKLNEWGDLFAGTVAPLAFLWLILGFLQQGEELQLNTKALELQAEELSKSVEHQRQMVEISRTQMENEIEASRLERAAQRDAAKPKFVYLGGGGMFIGNECNYDIAFQNVGNTATEIKMYIDLPSSSFGPSEKPILGRGERFDSRIKFNAPPTQPITLTISYIDFMGLHGESVFVLNRDLNDTHSVFTATLQGPNP